MLDGLRRRESPVAGYEELFSMQLILAARTPNENKSQISPTIASRLCHASASPRCRPMFWNISWIFIPCANPAEFQRA